MKRCPKCNRTYQTDTQKFCTHDGGLLFVVDSDDLSETVQFDSAKIRDAVSKPTTRDLGDQKPAGFDPEAVQDRRRFRRPLQGAQAGRVGEVAERVGCVARKPRREAEGSAAARVRSI